MKLKRKHRHSGPHVFESDPPELIRQAPVEIHSTEAKIQVVTNKSLSRVLLTLLPADTLIPQELSFGSSSALSREFALTGLTPGVDYFYFLTIIDGSGNITKSFNFGEFHTREI